MPVFWLDEAELVFPHPSLADPTGVLALGGDLRPERLLLAYQNGIFPWFNPGEEIMWWSPDPRFVLFPDELKVSRSMRPYFNQQKFDLTYDQAFPQVMQSCQTVNRLAQGQFGTWITESMLEAYIHLHELGYAHSVEVWEGEELVGGLYGVALGKVFFGESMFAKRSNASKFGFISLVRRLKEEGYTLIDCQQETRHLGSLGARSISRAQFLEHLEQNKRLETDTGGWG
ncbi:MAG: leucyl/phenylalanyl-tRNA--protein transferase [Saprospiraceae bacterium]|nr:leucyl/phenylalanyl-tRNA--protein transferase [Saprospiraceae bacterium]